MAIVYPYVAKCSCGASLTANLADGVNVSRTPAIREAIVAGRFHKVACAACKRTVTAEKSFFYTDLDRGTFIQVKPRQDRHLWRQASRALDGAITSIPQGLNEAGVRQVRVVFGMAELREKLIAEDLGLDDRAVELLKVTILNEHPFLARRPRLRLMLDGASDTELQFIASFDLDSKSFRIGLPIDAAREVAGNLGRLKEWIRDAGHKAPLFDLKQDHWVNIWRWSPTPGALDALKDHAERLRRGETLDTASEPFQTMLVGLPRGAQLPTWAKQDLQLLFNMAREKADDTLQERLFEIRFGKDIGDDWALNEDRGDIDTLWQLLHALPASNVEGNASINEINLANGEDGGWYEPNTGDIYIGSRLLSDREDFEDVIRHEVGHGVHEQRLDEVNAWLATAFGWHMFTPDRDGVEDWIGLMGGWDAFGVPEAERADIVRFLSMAIGPGESWTPGPTPNVPAGHSWWGRAFGPRLAFERTGANWYLNSSSWYRTGGQAFFLNFYYRTLCAVSEETLALVARMPSPYAAMSTFEFFAELYALYYDLDDPLRGNIPNEVARWLDDRVGHERRPARPMMRDKEAFETVTRPRSQKP